MLRSFLCVTLLAFSAATAVAEEAPAADAPVSAEEQAYNKAMAALNWIKGPATVDTAGKSQLKVPEGFVFLDQKNTDRFLELNQNLASGEEVLLAPDDMHWVAYLSFEDDGYVKDEDKIDAAELLKTLQQGTEQSNEERKRRGWPALHIIDWAIPPAYNTDNKRLEWATVLESEGRRNVNFATKVLARRGHTSIILVSSQPELPAARTELEGVLGGYSFKQGETYADWVPGDKVAEYGLAALVLGGAAAVATKKGLWAVLGGLLATGWKFLAAGVVAAGAGLRRFFGKKRAE